MEKLDDIKDHLKPGDILTTRPRWKALKELGLKHIIMRGADVLIQGTPFTHVALYAGDNKVVDVSEWNKKTKVFLIPLEKFSKRYAFKVLRVNASSAEKKDAVSWAKQQVGKDFDIPGLLRLALPVGKAHEKRHRQNDLKSMICSQMVANAYPHQNLGGSRLIQHVRPTDIQKSPLTRTVAEMK